MRWTLAVLSALVAAGCAQTAERSDTQHAASPKAVHHVTPAQKHAAAQRLAASNLEYRKTVQSEWAPLIAKFRDVHSLTAKAGQALENGNAVDASAMISQASSMMKNIVLTDESTLCPHVPDCHDISLAAVSTEDGLDKLNEAIDNGGGPPSTLVAARENLDRGTWYIGQVQHQVRADYVAHGGHADDITGIDS